MVKRFPAGSGFTAGGLDSPESLANWGEAGSSSERGEANARAVWSAPDMANGAVVTRDPNDVVPRGQRIVHTECPVVASPSGLPTRHLVTEREGASRLFLGEQWLLPGEQVKRHTHPVEEILTFLSGDGEASMADRVVPIGTGTSLHIPAGVVHGFSCTGLTPLHVLIIFATPSFAPTTLTSE